MTVLIFLAVLFVLILVHELGHFVAAKWSRMRVDEFAIGFPPRLLSIQKGETEYSINALPIGGYVKIFGENGTEEADGARAFGARPRLHQAIVLLAGVAMNILAAWLIFVAVAVIGTPTAVSEEEASEKAALTVVHVLDDSPAESLPLGSKILAVSSESGKLDTLTPSELVDFISQSDGPVSIQYEHKGSHEEVLLTPKTGVISDDPEREALGLSTSLVENRRVGIPTALWQATEKTFYSLILIIEGITSLLASAFTLSADISQVTGPIGIAGMVGEAAEFGLVPLLIFTAFISLNLAVINLLPIPALDGGRLLFVIAEAVIRRPIDPEWMARVNLIGFAFLMLLLLAVSYNDLAKYF